MRNPKNSWERSDSEFYNPQAKRYHTIDWDEVVAPEFPLIGTEDMKLACDLIKGGHEQRKFLRQIMVWFDITIPRYIWQELDTYKVATVRMSCGTMFDLGNRDLVQSDFQQPVYELTLEHINELGRLLREAKTEHEGVKLARQKLKNELPEGFLQRATYTLNYETALTIILQREHHRLPEWRLDEEGSITQTLMKLPYMGRFYDAATWKRDQIRCVISELTDIINAKDTSVEQLIALRDRLRAAV